MHVMVIPRGHYLSHKIPLSGIFESHQVQSLSESGITVGVLDPALIPFRFTFRRYPYKKREWDEAILIIRSYRRTLLPGRITPMRLKIFLLRRSICNSWEEYIALNGIPDLIHAHNILSGGVIAHYLGSKFQIPYVITEHSSEYTASNSFVRRDEKFLRPIIEGSHGIIAVGSALMDNLKSVFPGLELLGSTIPNVVDPVFENEIRNNGVPEFQKNKAIQIITIGNLIPRKDFGNLLVAFSKVFQVGEAQLSIVGEGPEESNLVRLVRNLGIEESVKFVGSPSREIVLDLLLNSDFFVLASRAESFGVVIIEALTCGLPVIATDCGGPSDILRVEQGFLIPVNDLNALTESLKEMSKTYKQFNRNQISKICLDMFGSKKFAGQILRKYDDILR